MQTLIEQYLAKIKADYKGGIATEHTYRSTLEWLLENFEPGVKASNDPKHIACGAPDFVVERRSAPLGYVETKDVGVDLDRIEKSDQMKRYRKALDNLILTDYLEFRWYVNGERKRVVRVASPGAKERLQAAPGGGENLVQLFRDFYTVEAPTVTSPKELAGRLAGVTHFIRDQIIAALASGEAGLQKSLEARYQAFRELLLPALKVEEFADLYAQAMTYGLFAAKLSAPEGEKFTLAGAYQFLFGNKFLRRLFSDVSEELDEIKVIRPYLLDIVSLLNRADFASILADFGRRTRTEDPVVHFYETFLAAYDPKLRESRGVYYTPEPVVQFIVRAVDDLLKTRFGKGWGLADPSVKILDPATGTGTFLYYVIQQIHEEVTARRNQAGTWPQKSRELLGRIFGFELLIAPYVVSHLKLGLLLQTLSASPEGRDERLQVYLTNTLEEGVTRAEQLAGLGHYIAEEASDAAHVKKRADIMVVLGNPPYSGHSANASVDKDGNLNFIGKLIREYYFVDGAPLGERNPKWLQDDYVKFIRFGEWRIDKTGHGVLAFITNHGYLDNPTFRGMRQHLMQTFDEIYVLDLHGNSKKKEKAPDGGKDENVFDIQQGVAILLAVKAPKPLRPDGRLPQIPRISAEFGGGREGAVVRHASLWGLRESKYAALQASALNDIAWQQLQPQKPFYLFVPQNIDLREEFEHGWVITDIFPVNNIAMQTHRDYFVTDFDGNQLQHRIIEFRGTAISDNGITEKYSLGNFDITKARKKVRDDKNWQKGFTNCLWRPFDIRSLYYHKELIDRPRAQVSDSMLYHNYGLLAMRQIALDDVCSHFLVTDNIPIDRVFYSNKGAASLFPLYLYTTPEETAGTLFAQSEVTRRANLAPGFVKALEEKLGMKFDPHRPSATSPKSDEPQSDLGEAGRGFTSEDIFHYAYAVFHSPTYRSRYAEFLKIDFPRLPLTSDKDLFFALAAKGKELVALHLLKTSKVDDFITSYPVAGDNLVEKVAFANGNVWINPRQYFGGVPQEVWEFKVGGYQVCEKWLKDRKGRVLSDQDIGHYQRVVVALDVTIRLMGEIDAAIGEWPMQA